MFHLKVSLSPPAASEKSSTNKAKTGNHCGLDTLSSSVAERIVSIKESECEAWHGLSKFGIMND